jgi:hypothetical protein
MERLHEGIVLPFQEQTASTLDLGGAGAKQVLAVSMSAFGGRCGRGALGDARRGSIGTRRGGAHAGGGHGDESICEAGRAKVLTEQSRGTFVGRGG